MHDQAPISYRPSKHKCDVQVVTQFFQPRSAKSPPMSFCNQKVELIIQTLPR